MPTIPENRGPGRGSAQGGPIPRPATTSSSGGRYRLDERNARAGRRRCLQPPACGGCGAGGDVAQRLPRGRGCRGSLGIHRDFPLPDDGVPGEPLPDGWLELPVAIGCTAESCASRDLVEDFVDRRHLAPAMFEYIECFYNPVRRTPTARCSAPPTTTKPAELPPNPRHDPLHHPRPRKRGTPNRVGYAGAGLGVGVPCSGGISGPVGVPGLWRATG